jgi:hypothetical protein
MKIGFGKVDITPRVGVELCGFGPYLNRHSIGVRDRLWARAAAFGDGTAVAVLASCDLIGISLETTREARRLAAERTGLSAEAVMIQCTHTHSGPSTPGTLIGWGDADIPYGELLPRRIADACVKAVESLAEARLAHAAVPCEGIGLNREYDRDAPPLEEVLKDDWRPAKPELTDTVCHVLKAEAAADGRLLGFMAYFGCHPVVCCAESRMIHGDYCGVAMGNLEREHPGAVGLFLQGAQGDVNSCVVHKPAQESLLALDVIAGRFARSVRAGLLKAGGFESQEVASVRREVTFSRKEISRLDLERLLEEKLAPLRRPGASDADGDVRMGTVYATGIRRLLQEMDGELPAPRRHTELHGVRLGKTLLLGAPFEVFQAIKNDVIAAAPAGVTPLVMGFVNDCQGYAPDRATAAKGGYAAWQDAFMFGRLPLASIHDELVRELKALLGDLTA